MFGLDGQPPAFDRVYNQADGIWVNYPQAEIKDRFAPVDRCATIGSCAAIWEAEGKRVAVRAQTYQPNVAATGQPLFTKPVTINFRSGKSDLAGDAMAALNQHVVPAGADGGAACTSASRATPTTSATRAGIRV